MYTVTWFPTCEKERYYCRSCNEFKAAEQMTCERGNPCGLWLGTEYQDCHEDQCRDFVCRNCAVKQLFAEIKPLRGSV